MKAFVLGNFLGLWLLASAAETPRLLGDEVVTHPFRGITLVSRTETAPRFLSIHVALIDLAAPGLRFKLTPPGGTRETLRQNTLAFLNQERAQLAINTHFYLPFTLPELDANLAGLAVSEGVVLSPFEPQPIGDGYVDQSYAIVPFAPALNIDPLNRASIVHHDPAQADNRHVLEPVTLWTAVSGSAQIVSDGMKTIPIYSGGPGGLNPLNGYSQFSSWYEFYHARTAIGLTEGNRTLILFTVDEVGTWGMTVGEVADMLINDYHAHNALNLDGDGSTSMAIEDPVTHTGRMVNVPSTGPEGRAVGCNLAVFAQPEPPPLRLKIEATPLRGVVLSWPRSEFAWELQWSSSLNPPLWRTERAQPEEAGGLMKIALPAVPEARFYRLAR